MAFAVPVLTLRPMGLAGGLARASIAVTLVNSVLIFAFYTSGVPAKPSGTCQATRISEEYATTIECSHA